MKQRKKTEEINTPSKNGTFEYKSKSNRSGMKVKPNLYCVQQYAPLFVRGGVISRFWIYTMYISKTWN